MALLGSFVLLFALILAAYSLVAGILAIVYKHQALGETARRAGMATFFGREKSVCSAAQIRPPPQS